MSAVKTHEDLANEIDGLKSGLRMAKYELDFVSQRFDAGKAERLELVDAMQKVMHFEEDLAGAEALLVINFDNYRSELRSIRRAGYLTWPERERLDRWLETGFQTGYGQTERRDFLRLILTHLAATL